MLGVGVGAGIFIEKSKMSQKVPEKNIYDSDCWKGKEKKLFSVTKNP